MESSTGLLGLLTKLGMGNIGVVTAAFLGALISVGSFAKQGWKQMLLTLATGFFSSVYGTPLVVRYFALDDSLGYGLAFFIGLLAMNLIPAIRRFLERKLEAKS